MKWTTPSIKSWERLIGDRWRTWKNSNSRSRTPPLAFDEQKLVLAGKKVNIKLGDEELLLTSTRKITCLPSPEQRQQGKNDGQTFNEGVSLCTRFQAQSRPAIRTRQRRREEP